MDKYSMNFGKKERVLNYACQTYQLSRPNKVGAVMALIRECQPNSYEEWQKWYFQNAHTSGKKPFKITTERMKASFESFKEQYGGNVFVVFSLDGEIANKEVISQIEEEIYRLSTKYEE